MTDRRSEAVVAESFVVGAVATAALGGGLHVVGLPLTTLLLVPAPALILGVRTLIPVGLRDADHDERLYRTTDPSDVRHTGSGSGDGSPAVGQAALARGFRLVSLGLWTLGIGIALP